MFLGPSVTSPLQKWVEEEEGETFSNVLLMPDLHNLGPANNKYQTLAHELKYEYLN